MPAGLVQGKQWGCDEASAFEFCEFVCIFADDESRREFGKLRGVHELFPEQELCWGRSVWNIFFRDIHYAAIWTDRPDLSAEGEGTFGDIRESYQDSARRNYRYQVNDGRVWSTIYLNIKCIEFCTLLFYFSIRSRQSISPFLFLNDFNLNAIDLEWIIWGINKQGQTLPRRLTQQLQHAHNWPFPTLTTQVLRDTPGPAPYLILNRLAKVH